MPAKVAAVVRKETNTSNSVSGVIEKLAALLQADKDVVDAYLCTNHVHQIYRIDGEGNHFCGYRNMQMLLSGLSSTTSLPTFSGMLMAGRPTILELQEAIEAAWEAGINAHGQVMTGGIAGTRKHVGASEVNRIVTATFGRR